MINKLIFAAAVFLCFQPLRSQGFAANIGYDYIGKNALYIGLDYRLNGQSPQTRGKNIGLGSYITFTESKTKLIPNVHYTYPLGNLVWEAHLILSTKNVSPSFGANILNAVSLNAGYNITFKEKEFQGPYIGLHWRFGGKQFYDQMKFF